MNSEELALAIEAKRPELLRVVESMLRPSGMADDAEDFFQEAALRLFASPTEYDFSGDDAVGKLLLTTMMRLMFNRKDSIKVRDRGHDEFTRVYQPDSQAHMKQREQLKADLELAMNRLDDRTRQVVRLAWMEGQTNRQIQDALKMAPNTIVELLRDALPVLQQELARYDHRQRVTARPLPIAYTTKERKTIADSLRRDRRVRQPGPLTITKLSPEGEILSTDTYTVGTWRKLHPRPVSASQPPYKEESGETDSTMPLGGTGHETSPVETSMEDLAA